MRAKTIKNVDHVVYDTMDEFRAQHDDQEVYADWRNAPEGEWCLSDDGQVLTILKRGQMRTQRGRVKTRDYVRTLLGTYMCNPNIRMEGDIPKNIYSLGGDHFIDEWRFNGRERPTSSEERFAIYVYNGMDVVEAYKRAFPATKSEQYARTSAARLVRTDRVKQLIKDQVQAALSKTQISEEYLLDKAKGILEDKKSNDKEKVAILKTLMQIADMFPQSEKRTESLAVFQGFSREDLKRLEKGATKEIKGKEIEGDEG